MNTYFLSLCEPDKMSRKKNIACVYNIKPEDNDSVYNFINRCGNLDKNLEKFSLYIISRFPYISKGDLVLDDDVTMVFCDEKFIFSFEPQMMINPFFYFYVDPEREYQLFP